MSSQGRWYGLARHVLDLFRERSIAYVTSDVGDVVYVAAESLVKVMLSKAAHVTVVLFLSFCFSCLFLCLGVGVAFGLRKSTGLPDVGFLF